MEVTVNLNQNWKIKEVAFNLEKKFEASLSEKPKKEVDTELQSKISLLWDGVEAFKKVFDIRLLNGASIN